MGLENGPDIFQEKMGDLFADQETVQACIHNLLVLTKGSWEDHLAKLEKVLCRLQNPGLKVNTKKYIFCKQKLEYHWYSTVKIKS